MDSPSQRRPAIQVDMWPDVSELASDERCPTPLTLPDGRAADLFSAYNLRTVDRHFRWLREYDLPGVFLQRFSHRLDSPAVLGFRDGVARNVRTAAELHGRVFAIMQDISGSLMTLLLPKRSGMALERDLIFLAESGEKADPTGVGIRFMAERHFDEINAEFAIAEGNGGTIENGRVRTVEISTSEKVPRRVRLVATGTSGHGSVPRLDNAVTHLARAVEKVGTCETPMRLNETTRMYFEKLASISDPERAARYRSLLDPQRSAAAQRYLAEHEPVHYSA